MEAFVSPAFTFPAALRLTHDLQYQAVHAARMRKNVGPLSIGSLPNRLPHWRLGLAVSRKCGNAVTRNLVKRRIRESFRLAQHDLPRLEDGTGLDIVVSPRAHHAMTLGEHQILLKEVAAQLIHAWNQRLLKRKDAAP